MDQALRPSASTTAQVSRAASFRSRYVMPTWAPAVASARAIAIPSVPVPPATSATRSLRSMSRESIRNGRAETRSGLESRVEDVAQTVADQVHREHGEQDAEARERGYPPRLAQVVAPLAQHAAPLRLRRLAAQAQEAEGGGREDGAAEAEGGGDDQRGHHVGQDVAHQDAPVAPAERARRLDVEVLARGQHSGADQAGIARHRGKPDRNHHVA